MAKETTRQTLDDEVKALREHFASRDTHFIDAIAAMAILVGESIALDPPPAALLERIRSLWARGMETVEPTRNGKVEPVRWV